MTERCHALYEFSDSRFVEVLARCCRVWLDKRTLDPEAIKLAETVIQAGITQLPKDPFMVILYSTFLMDVQSSYQSGYTQLQVISTARLLPRRHCCGFHGSCSYVLVISWHGLAHSQLARKMETNFLTLFAVFSREQQHAQRSTAGAGVVGSQAADAVSYVEFERNVR
jgi:hypothetical protein